MDSCSAGVIFEYGENEAGEATELPGSPGPSNVGEFWVVALPRALVLTGF